ncbi:GNAT family N-acetyltransferase [Novosphingobium sp. FSY-8]|uniref:GNAT family N-acetyltransferase n=1 Tax=Novosphingobium ovatum TaxID=1908523 RepID=A0ABW9XD96_9SPHN|nr:GNAT family N-acetyltransferase [Novosphingobium ovatum]NBC36489.1 GNAT family N-acetyltransferase [Novosphingobium ovatum]
MFFRSERLFLRPLWSEDWQALHHQINDAEVVRHLARAPWPYTEEDARWFAGQTQDERYPHFLITRPRGDDGVDTLGVIGLHDEGGETALGYWLGRDHWGQGYATEAARAVIDIARAIGHRHLIAMHFLDNPASAGVLARAGFRDTGDVLPMHSLARGGKALARKHVLELSHDGDTTSDDDNSGPMMRAA